MNFFSLAGRLGPLDKRRIYTLLLSLYFLLAVFAVGFHTHRQGDRHVVHDTCGFCQVVQAGGLAGGATPAAVRVALALTPLYALIITLATSRPILPQVLISHGNRAPPSL